MSCNTCDSNTCDGQHGHSPDKAPHSDADREQIRAEQDGRLKKNLARIRHKWLVLSGKGGVGKTTVAVNLACGLVNRGFRVGLIDTDIHGPNVVKMLGLEDAKPSGEDNMVEPIKTLRRLKVISLASFLPDPDAAVIWRGPMKMNAIRQFLADVDWGALDHLVIDSPPGTGDEPLSTAQLLGTVDGAIIVTTPQDVALLDSRKCVNFARQLDLPVAGIIENMSGMTCPHCGEAIDLFGVGGGKRSASQLAVPFLGAIPIDPAIVVAGDTGRPVLRDDTAAGPTAAAIDQIVDRVVGERAS